MLKLDLNENDDKNIKFYLERDYIDRNKYINSVLLILNKLEENTTISLDGEWGSGKTIFLKSLEYLIKNNNETEFKNITKENIDNIRNEFDVYYYNAWENDDANSAMLSLIYKIVNDYGIQHDNEKAEIVIKSLNAILKFVSRGSFELQDFFNNDMNMKELTEDIQTSEEVKQHFNNIIDEILAERKNKMLIIIDEIDRCKPTFAIEILENIKHFYNNEKIIFIIGTNNKALSHSVCKVYGEKYDGAGYLDRFFDINLYLPSNYLERYIYARDEYRFSQYIEFQIPRELAKHFKLTMREYERLLKCFDIVGDFYSSDDSISRTVEEIIIPLSILLKVKFKEKYYGYIEGNNIDILKTFVTESIYFRERLEYNYKSAKNIDEKDDDKTIFSKEISWLSNIYNNMFKHKNNALDKESFKYKNNYQKLIDIISMMR